MAQRTGTLFGPMLALGFGVAVTGCQGTSPPRLTIADVVVTEVTEQGSAMTVIVRAENPNDRPLPLRTITYDVSLDGRQVFTSTQSAEAVLPRFGVLDLPLPVAVPASVRPADPSEFRLSMTLRYRNPGTLAETLYDAHLWRPAISASGEGVVDLSGSR